MENIRCCVVGDLHGRDCWLDIIPNRFSKIIFLADYCDSYTHSNAEILHNLKQIIEFKKEYKDKVVLLLGNHDLQYWEINNPVAPKCIDNGYRLEMAHDLYFLFKENEKLFQVAYQIGNYLFTHAGISEGWYNQHRDVIKGFWDLLADSGGHTGVNLAEVLNKLAQTRHRGILHDIGEARRGDFGTFGGPFWADYKETSISPLQGYRQIVGHTPKNDIESIHFNETTSITYVDVLATREKIYELEISY